MLRQLYMANAEMEARGATPREAEEKYRLHIAALVENGQMEVEKAPIILPNGVAKNEEVKKKQKRERAEFLQMLHRLQRLDALIDQLRENIALLEEQKAEAQRLSDLAFDRYHDAESLLKAIADGVSDYERSRLIDLLGDDAIDADTDTLRQMLEEKMAEEKKNGLRYDEEINELDDKINEARERLNKAIEVRDELKSPTSEEHLSRALDEVDCLLDLLNANRESIDHTASHDAEISHTRQYLSNDAQMI